jgi:uncharacterized membrane protein YadS
LRWGAGRIVLLDPTGARLTRGAGACCVASSADGAAAAVAAETVEMAEVVAAAEAVELAACSFLPALKRFLKSPSRTGSIFWGRVLKVLMSLACHEFLSER